jgi:hypothetical protein
MNGKLFQCANFLDAITGDAKSVRVVLKSVRVVLKSVRVVLKSVRVVLESVGVLRRV